MASKASSYQARSYGAGLGTADAWGWAFGAGDGSALQHPVYTYTTPGQYTVTQNITDTDSGETAGLTRTGTITVTSGTPVTPSEKLNFTELMIH